MKTTKITTQQNNLKQLKDYLNKTYLKNNLKISKNEIYKRCQYFGYDYEVLPCVLETTASLLKLFANIIYKDLNKEVVND